jgi:deoxyribodipyrimidine photo-lyase
MTRTSPATIVWFRRDLRLHDNPALAAAAAGTSALVPLYVLDPRLLRGRWSSSNRTWFLLASLRGLDARLREVGSRLHVRVGDPAKVVPDVAASVGARTVHVASDVSPFAARRDAAVAQGLARDRATLVAHPGLLVHPPDAVRTRDGRPYVVFGPYRRTWEAIPRRAIEAAPTRLPPRPRSLDPGAVPDLAGLGLPEPTADPASFPEPGELAARGRLESWLRDGLARYAGDRDRLDVDGTSHLSQDLRFGLLSPLELVERAAGRSGADAWLAELCWRDFYLQLLAHHPEVLRRPFRTAFERLRWIDDNGAFAAWRDGRTGHPVVDAAMRQLAATGFMPNRARMIVASFLAKDLLLDWRLGEAHFMRLLLDGDPAANDGGWQWAASTGTDAQPWFRVFDPVSQGRRFDPEGAWIRRWIPELSRVPDHSVHTPWTMSPEEQAEAGCILGADYPRPIVDHREARARWLDAVAAAGIAAGTRS